MKVACVQCGAEYEEIRRRRGQSYRLCADCRHRFRTRGYLHRRVVRTMDVAVPPGRYVIVECSEHPSLVGCRRGREALARDAVEGYLVPGALFLNLATGEFRRVKGKELEEQTLEKVAASEVSVRVRARAARYSSIE